MHRDMATECFKLPKMPSEWWKQKGPGGGNALRFYTKNQFVFPQFYGSYYLDCARNLWESMEKNQFAMGDTTIQEHLKEQGIKRRGSCSSDIKPLMGTFEHHIKQVEDHFWNKRFHVYRDWKKSWYQAYLKKGYYDTVTGFRISGVMRRNDVINYGIQGSAFHCLLWSLIELQERLKRKRMRAKIIGQIHDSILADVPVNELDTFLPLARKIMVEEIAETWPWIIVPLEVEAEVTSPGGNWYDKKEVRI
jgi:hypothetical protein